MSKLLEEIDAGNELTQFVREELEKKLAVLPEEVHDELISEAKALSSIGISSEDDYRNFFYIFRHVKTIAEDLSGIQMDSERLSKISGVIFENIKYYPIDTIYNFYKAVASALDKLSIPVRKFSYPLGYRLVEHQEPYNVAKWIGAMREIYMQVHRGLPFSKSFDIVTSGWEIMEKRNFSHWMKFHQGNNHQKYKIAQDDYVLDSSGAPLAPFRDFQALQAKVPGMPEMGGYVDPEVYWDHKKEQEEKKKKEEERKAEIKRQEKIDNDELIRSKIVSRLNAAINVATKPEARIFLKELGIDLPSWVEQVENIRRIVQTASPLMIKDLIIRQGNILASAGYPEAGEQMKVFAEEVKAEEQPQSTQPPEAPPAPPVSSEPSEIPEEEEYPGSDAMDEVVKNMQGLPDSNDLGEEDDCLDAQAALVVVAQPVPEEMVTETVDPAEEEPDIEVSDEVLEEVADPTKEMPATMEESDFDLSGITTTDVISKLELVSNILKNREIPRQLSMIDLMMDQLGIASYFPTLGEATRSALESNQYMATRIEDILSKLRGSVEPSEEDKIELAPEGIEPEAAPEEVPPVEEVKERLSDADKKQEELREARKKKREQLYMGEGVEKPEIEVEELEAPVEVEKAPARRVE
jgi:hypothetical protein